MFCGRDTYMTTIDDGRIVGEKMRKMKARCASVVVVVVGDAEIFPTYISYAQHAASAGVFVPISIVALVAGQRVGKVGC
jgi:hypothetical protein